MFRKDFNAKAQRRKGNLKITFASLRLCLGILFVLCAFTSCKREERKFTQPPSSFKAYDVTMSDIHPGSAGLPQPVQNAAEERAVDLNEGKRLYTQYNCSEIGRAHV